MKRGNFSRGDIVRLNLQPVAGREQQGVARPALVLTAATFNRLGLAVVAPITQGGDFARHRGFAVTLSGAGTETQGVVLCNQLRSVDLEARCHESRGGGGWGGSGRVGSSSNII
ncbi:type II toxin-antitoxin system ChpB family toxin [Pseudomonas cremoricolorata]|uniref:type II toxin-antitoxin system ChpB family toxin n=1 Tax=Pseudomonas cremoricolorata TaxID=157783 RepID=UPI0023E3CA58|nr:type II toxin-antitoxin system ChpB family toxin [Pseudomonas cremoricolorata]